MMLEFSTFCTEIVKKTFMLRKKRDKVEQKNWKKYPIYDIIYV